MNKILNNYYIGLDDYINSNNITLQESEFSFKCPITKFIVNNFMTLNCCGSSYSFRIINYKKCPNCKSELKPFTYEI